MFYRGHELADPDYINIGDSELIEKRSDYEVGIDLPGGNLGEYVPFYFGRLSPMLLNIKTGKKGIVKRPQKDIVYVVCKLETIVECCDEWCFTDGHAKAAITGYYNHLDALVEIHWDKVDLRYWNNTEEEFDRMRQKQTEFLVKREVPVKCIKGLVTYNNEAAQYVKQIVEELNLEIPVKINPGENYYYY